MSLYTCVLDTMPGTCSAVPSFPPHLSSVEGGTVRPWASQEHRREGTCLVWAVEALTLV